MMIYILLVCNSCFFSKESWYCYVVWASNGFRVVSFYKNLISYLVRYL